MIRFRVAGRPAPQGSKRHVGGGRMVESSRAVGPWREAVRAETQRVVAQARPYCAICHQAGRVHYGPVAVMLAFLLPRPKGHYGTGRNAGTVRESAPSHPTGRPDLDKLARAVLDGLTAGGAFADDSQVVDLAVVKEWCDVDETPGVVIEIDEAK